jgi:hypothetical protein
MARAPRASISKTSGQGVSRLSYQRGRALAKAADAPAVKTDFGGGKQREYGKGKAAGKIESKFNISYGDTFHPTDLEDVKALGELKPMKGWADRRESAKTLK